MPRIYHLSGGEKFEETPQRRPNSVDWDVVSAPESDRPDDRRRERLASEVGPRDQCRCFYSRLGLAPLSCLPCFIFCVRFHLRAYHTRLHVARCPVYCYRLCFGFGFPPKTHLLEHLPHRRFPEYLYQPLRRSILNLGSNILDCA